MALGGEAGMFGFALIFLTIESMILGGLAVPGTANVVNPVILAINNPAPQQPQPSGCSSTWWNPTTWGCSISSTAQSIYYLFQIIYYVLIQIVSIFLVPINAIILVATWSAAYPWLGAINAIAAIFLIYPIVHGLV